jgi:hypothetical protein
MLNANFPILLNALLHQSKTPNLLKKGVTRFDPIDTRLGMSQGPLKEKKKLSVTSYAYKMRNISETFKESFSVQDVSKIIKISRKSKSGTNRENKNSTHCLRGNNSQTQRKIISRLQYDLLHRPKKNHEWIRSTTKAWQPPKYPTTSSQQTGRGEAEQTPGRYVCFQDSSEEGEKECMSQK